MSAPIPQCTRASYSVARLINRSLLLFLTLSLLAGTTPAQTEPEAQRAAAERLISEAKQISQEGTKDAYRKAIEKFEQALMLSRAIGDQHTEAKTLANIGLMYQWMEENQQALDHFNQALPLARAAGDQRTQAFLLTKSGLVHFLWASCRRRWQTTSRRCRSVAPPVIVC